MPRLLLLLFGLACAVIPKLQTAECTVVERSADYPKQQAERVLVQVVDTVDGLEFGKYAGTTLRALNIAAESAKEPAAQVHPLAAPGAFKNCESVQLLNEVPFGAYGLVATDGTVWHYKGSRRSTNFSSTSRRFQS